MTPLEDLLARPIVRKKVIELYNRTIEIGSILFPSASKSKYGNVVDCIRKQVNFEPGSPAELREVLFASLDECVPISFEDVKSCFFDCLPAQGESTEVAYDSFCKKLVGSVTYRRSPAMPLATDFFTVGYDQINDSDVDWSHVRVELWQSKDRTCRADLCGILPSE